MAFRVKAKVPQETDKAAVEQLNEAVGQEGRAVYTFVGEIEWEFPHYDQAEAAAKALRGQEAVADVQLMLVK
jgi:hypothetical protein